MSSNNISDVSIQASVSGNANTLDSVVPIYNWIVYTVLCQSIVFIGIGTNIVNIICFIKQGFEDAINVSLLGLTVADLGSLVTVICTIVCMNPALSASDLPFEPLEFQYLVTGMVHALFTRVSGWMTALITVERCLCVTAPMKVKSILTTTRVSIAVVVIYIALIASGSPVYVVNKLDWQFSAAKNKTMLRLVFIGDHDLVENTSYIINNTILPFCSFAVVIVATLILTVNLQSQSKWRKKSIQTAQAESLSNRNTKVVKMVVMISVIFIVCFIPICLIFLVMSFNPDFTITGKHHEIMFMIGGFGLCLEAINASVNIFIYYSMSSKYRRMLHSLFCSVRAEAED